MILGSEESICKGTPEEARNTIGLWPHRWTKKSPTSPVASHPAHLLSMRVGRAQLSLLIVPLSTKYR